MLSRLSRFVHGFPRFVSGHGFSRADCRAKKSTALAAATILLLIHPAQAQHITFRDIRLADDNTYALVEDCRIHRSSLTVRYRPLGAITYVVPDTGAFRQPRTVYIRGYLMATCRGK